MHSSNSYTPPAAIPEFIIRHATLRQFQIFEAIVRLGSYTRAAEELFLTQPTVSMQTKKLSDAIGMPLFEQVGRKVKPTEAGEVLYASVRTIFDTLSNVEMAVSDLKGIKRGRIRLGVITTAKYFAPELLGLFSDQYPGVEVALKVSNRDRILDRISHNEDDLYIIGQAPADATDLVVHPFSPNPLVVMAPKNHPLVGRKNITLEELAEQPLIMREPGSGIRDATLRMFEERGLRPNVRMELGSNEAIKHAVYGGLGLAILSLHTLRLEGRSGPIELLDVESFPIMRQWFIVYPKGKELSLVAKEFLDFSISHEINIREELMRDFPEVFDDREKMAKLKAVK